MARFICIGRRYVCDEKVIKARLLFARELVMNYGVPYDAVWQLTGFTSRKEMERYWNSLF